MSNALDLITIDPQISVMANPLSVVSSTKAQKKRKIMELPESIQTNSTLVVTEISRLGGIC